MAGRPVLSDIARLAETSTATVSRVLSGRGAVTKSTADRVMRVVEATGFVLDHRRSAAARLRRTPRALKYRAIGVLVMGDVGLDANAVYQHDHVRGVVLDMVLDAVLSAAEKEGVRVNIYKLSGDDLDRGTVPPSLAGSQLDGLLSQSPTGHNCASIEDVAPVVFFGSHPTESCVTPSVEPENALAMDAIAQHLFDLGHRRFAFISGRRIGSQLHRSLFVREHSFVESATARGCKVTVIGIEQMQAEDTAAAIMAQSLAERPTAFVGCNDGVAIRLLSSFAAKGIRVPADVSVTGFDGLRVGGMVFPALTTWAPDWGAVGRLSVSTLLARLRGETVPVRTMVGGELCVRASSGPAPVP